MKPLRCLVPVALSLCLVPIILPSASSGSPTGLELLATYHVDGAGKALAWSPDGARLGVASGTGVLVISAADGTVIFNLSAPDEPGPATAVQWTPDGSKIFTSNGRGAVGAGDNGSVRAWNATTGLVMEELGTASGDCLAISPDGKWRASSGSGTGYLLELYSLVD